MANTDINVSLDPATASRIETLTSAIDRVVTTNEQIAALQQQNERHLSEVAELLRGWAPTMKFASDAA